MKFKVAVITSAVLHAILFIVIILTPAKTNSNETRVYVNYMQLSGGGNQRAVRIDRSANAQVVAKPSGKVSDLAVEKKSDPALRYPDKENKKNKEAEDNLISVVRKDPKTPQDNSATGSATMSDPNALTTGISTGSSGTGAGSGPGGLGGAYFPYDYYIRQLQNKISAAWYNSLVTPGLRGKFTTAVRFQIQRNGKVSDLEIEKPSDIESLDLSALRAVQNASPFPPLPNDFPAQYLVVHFAFEWEK